MTFLILRPKYGPWTDLSSDSDSKNRHSMGRILRGWQHFDIDDPIALKNVTWSDCGLISLKLPFYDPSMISLSGIPGLPSFRTAASPESETPCPDGGRGSSIPVFYCKVKIVTQSRFWWYLSNICLYSYLFTYFFTYCTYKNKNTLFD